MAKAKPAAKKSNKTDEMKLELEGKVFVVDTIDGKTTRTELKGDLVLKCVLQVLQKALADGSY